MRQLPQYLRHARLGAVRAGPDAYREPAVDRRGHIPDDAWSSVRLGGRSAGRQAGEQHALCRPQRRPAPRGGLLSRGAEMSESARDGEGLKGIELDERLTRTWSRAPGLWGWITTVDHKEIGRRYIWTTMTFMVLGGVLAGVMRAQLARPESGLISADRYNQIFTMHGTTMMFLFAVPVMEAIAIYIIPLMVGTRNIAFLRLNAFSY